MAHRGGWTAVVPVKHTAVAKSRLTADPVLRRRLALAFAVDTVRALTRCPAVEDVLVVTDDSVVAEAVRSTHVAVVADTPGTGLNAALLHGVDVARGARADAAVALVSADLPALRPDELAVVLTACADHRSAFVCDAAGVGTTMLTAAPGVAVQPRFGPRSRAAHRRVAVDIVQVTAPTVRRDVDTWVDLWDACRMGVGPATRAAL